MQYLLMFRVVFWYILPCKIIIAPLKRRSTTILHGSTTQKTALNIILAAVRTRNLTQYLLFKMTDICQRNIVRITHYV
jgi:hypothetical protein